MKKIFLLLFMFTSNFLLSQSVGNSYLNTNKSSLKKSPKSWINKYLDLLGKSIDDNEVQLFVKAIEHKIPKDSLVTKDNYISEGNDFRLIWIHGILKEIRIENSQYKDYSKFEAISYMKKYSLKNYMKDGVETKSKGYFEFHKNKKNVVANFSSKGSVSKKKPYKMRLYYKNIPNEIVFNEFDKKIGSKKFEYEYLLMLVKKRYDSYLAQYYFVENENQFTFNKNKFTFTLNNKGIDFVFLQNNKNVKLENDRRVHSIYFDVNEEKKLPGSVSIEDFLQSYNTGKYDKIKSFYKKSTFIDYKVTCDKKYFEIHKHLIVALKNNKGVLEAKGIDGFPSRFKLNYYAIPFKEMVRKAYRNRDRLNKVFNSNRCVTNRIRKEKTKNFYSAIPLEQIVSLIQNDFKSIKSLNSNYIENKTLLIPNAKKSYLVNNNERNKEFIIEFKTNKNIAKYLQTRRKKRVKDLTISNYQSNIGALIYKREFIGNVYQKNNKVIFNSYSENDFFNQIYNFLNTSNTSSKNYLFNEAVTSKQIYNQIVEYTFANSKKNPYYFQNYLSCSYLNMRSENFKNKYKVSFKESFITQKFSNQISTEICNVHFTFKNKSGLLSFNTLNKQRDRFKLIIGLTSEIKEKIKRLKQESNENIVFNKTQKNKDRYLNNLKRIKEGKDPIFTQSEIFNYFTASSDFKQIKSGKISKAYFNKSNNLRISSYSPEIRILVKTPYAECDFNVYKHISNTFKVGKKYNGGDGYYKQKYEERTKTLNADFKTFTKSKGYKGNGTIGLRSINILGVASVFYDRKGKKKYATELKLSPKKCNYDIKEFIYYIFYDKADLEYQQKIKNYKNSPYNKNKGIRNLFPKGN